MEKKQTIPEVMLNNGEKMPMIAMGTTAHPLPPPDVLASAFLNAIEAGYRHFDTAELYGSEPSLGRAVAEAIQRGLVSSRRELFITSKVWCNNADPHLVLPALKGTLERLGVEYVDMYLIHWPLRMKKEVEGLKFTKEDFLPLDMKGTWKAMEECCKMGLAKSIGISNFSAKKISQLLEAATIPPAVNQVEMNVGWQQLKLLEFCREKGIHVSAWSPLAANGASWGSLAVMESPILKEIAEAKGNTIAQIALRWIYEQGVTIVVKSFNKERMKANLQIFDFQLNQEELEKIKQIPQHRGFSGKMYISKDGPYKSLQELWDEEA